MSALSLGSITRAILTDDGTLDQRLVDVEQVAVQHLATVRRVKKGSGEETSTRAA